MNKSIHFVICFLILIGLSSDVLSRGGSSSRSSSSRSSSSRSSSSSSRSSSRPSTPSTIKKVPSTTSTVKKAPAPVTNTTTVNKPETRTTAQPSTIKKTTTTKTEKPKAVKTSAVTKQKAKAMASTNKAAAAKYGTKANAEKAYREKIAASNKYNSPTPPATRPDNIPQSITINNMSVRPDYGMLPGGYYGYGYMDPVTHMMVALTAHQMIVNDAMMMNDGYGQWDSSGRPVIVHTGTSRGLIILFVIIGFVFIMVVILKISKVI